MAAPTTPASHGTVTVVLAAHGEAETAGFLENFMVGHRTLGHVSEVVALPAPVRWAICLLAAVRKRLGGCTGSPHNALTRRQAQALEAQLAAGAGAIPCQVVPAFGSSLPLLEDVVAEMATGSLRVVVSMMPIDSRLACGRLCHELAAHAVDAAGPGSAGGVGAAGQVRVLARLWEDRAFVAVNVDHVFTQLELPENSERCALVLVMHGTLVRDTRGQTPDFHTGMAEATAYAGRLREAFATDPRSPFTRIEVAHLNHDVGGEWTRPTLQEVLQRLAGEGVDAVAAYPCEYLVEGSDTVGKVADALAASPIRRTQRLACLNDAPAFIDFLAQRVQALAGPDADIAARRCDACPLGRDRKAGG